MRHSCDEYMEHLSNRYDQGQEPDEETLAHLRSCGDCRSFQAMWSGEEDSFSKVAALPCVAPASESIVEKVLTSREPKPEKQVKTWLSIGGGIAAAIILALGLVIPNIGRSTKAGPVVEGLESEGLTQPPEETIELSLRVPRLERADFADEIAVVGAVGSMKIERSSRRIADLVIGVREFTTSFSKYLPTR